MCVDPEHVILDREAEDCQLSRSRAGVEAEPEKDGSQLSAFCSLGISTQLSLVSMIFREDPSPPPPLPVLPPAQKAQPG